MTQLQIRIDLVNGTYIPDYPMSVAEFSYRIIGDDHGPPALAWGLSFITEDGQSYKAYFDPKDEQSLIQFSVDDQYGNEENDTDGPSCKQLRIAFLANNKIDQLAELLQYLHPTQQSEMRKKVNSLTITGGSRKNRFYHIAQLYRFIRIKPRINTLKNRIERSASRNENVSFAQPVIIHATSQSTVELIPMTIKRSVANEFKIKLKSYNSRDAPFSVISFKSDGFLGL